MPTLIEKIASDEVIDTAYQWLCKKRHHYHPNAEVWQLRRWWHEKKPILQAQILSGNFQLRELRLIRGEEKSIEWWSSLDALVLKAMTIVLTEHLKPVLSTRCFHLAGNGGLKGAVREVAANIEEHPFVFRTDVKGYYASINHGILMDIVGKYVQDDEVLRLLWGYLRRFVSDGGEYIDITQGISLGCPLSPLIGALFLKPLDDRMAELGCFYVRYMDDWVILAPTRWKLRKAIKATNQVMSELRVIKHPDKTFIGRVARGFDFLGYWFSPAGLGIARKTVERMVENMLRLYEQGAPDERIEAYFQRWYRWVIGGVSAKQKVDDLTRSCRAKNAPLVYRRWLYPCARVASALLVFASDSALVYVPLRRLCRALYHVWVGGIILTLRPLSSSVLCANLIFPLLHHTYTYLAPSGADPRTGFAAPF